MQARLAALTGGLAGRSSGKGLPPGKARPTLAEARKSLPGERVLSQGPAGLPRSSLGAGQASADGDHPLQSALLAPAPSTSGEWDTSFAASPCSSRLDLQQAPLQAHHQQQQQAAAEKGQIKEVDRQLSLLDL